MHRRTCLVDPAVYSQIARTDTGTHTNPGQQGGNIGAHCCPRCLHRPAMPVPYKATFCGLLAALSWTLTAAVRVPVAVGLNVTLIVQLAPTAKKLPQV